MDRIAISKFKSTCLAVLKRVNKTRKPVLVTRFGKPIAVVTPPSPHPRPAHWIGCMQDSGQIVGDLVQPLGDDDWEILHP